MEDAVKLDPKHYKIEFENEKVRVVRVKYGPGERSVMHGHPDLVALFLTDVSGKFTYPDGKTESISGKAGQAMWMPSVKHLPENTSQKPFEVILVEMKSK